MLLRIENRLRQLTVLLSQVIADCQEAAAFGETQLAAVERFDRSIKLE
jgi:hypothetical protein